MSISLPNFMVATVTTANADFDDFVVQHELRNVRAKGHVASLLELLQP